MKNNIILKISCLCFVFILSACSVFTPAISQTHPANNYFENIEYPRVGMNQISTKKISKNPSVVRDLANFDFVIINKSDDIFVDGRASTDYAKRIKSINPNVKVLQYLNITDIWQGQKTFKEWMKNNPAMFLKGQNGQFVHPYHKDYGDKRFMMDSTNSQWQNFYAHRIKKIVDQGMDGVFIDNLWRSNYQNLDISPHKFRQIQQGWETSLQQARALVGSNKVVIGNSPAYGLYQTRDMTMIEGRLKPNKNSLDEYFKLSDQSTSYDQLNFDTVQFDTYNGSNFDVVELFLLPAVLLTDNIWGISYEGSQWTDFVKYVGKIGTPVNKRSLTSEGVWVRDFTKGRVYLNTSGKASTITLNGGNFARLNGKPVNTITLKSNEGIVLRKN